MSTFKTVDDMQVSGKTVLVRCDLNVPMKDGTITDTTRIDRSLATLSELVDKGARVVVLSHFGRPKGHVVAKMSLRPIADALAKKMGKDVAFAPLLIDVEIIIIPSTIKSSLATLGTVIYKVLPAGTV